MKFTHVQRRLPVLAGAVALAAMGTITAACGGGENGPASTTTTTTTTTTTSTTSAAPPPAPPPTPTQNQIDPSGANSFTPNPIPVQPGPPMNGHGIGSPTNPHNR